MMELDEIQVIKAILDHREMMIKKLVKR